MAEESKDCMPKLRFPEFRKSAKWEKENLGKLLVCRPEYGVNAPAVPYSPYLPTYIRITDISDSGTFIKEKRASVDIETTPKNYLQIGDIVLARTGSVGKAYKYRPEDGELVFAGFLIRIRPDTGKINPDYLFHYLFTPQYWDWVRFISMRSSQPGINGAEYASMPLPICSLPEQQKIADCLSSLDELIEAHEQKRDALVEHKKGLMQRLFPADGENTPRWRFPEFRKANAWDQKSLGQVCKTFSGGTPSTSNKAYYGGDIPFIRSAEINKTKTELFLTEQGFKDSSAKLVKEGDILLALYGANSGEVAISKISGAINQAILCLRSNQNNYFIFHYLFFKKDYFISKYLQGGQGNFSAEIVKAISIPLPSIPEQQKIADCLSSLDARIEAEEGKIASLREHKQGLMQRLFPQSR